jgi:hypothetical protein
VCTAAALRAHRVHDRHDGEQAVRGYCAVTRTAFPDQDHEIISSGTAPTR